LKTQTILAAAVALQFLAVPAMAQGKSDKDANAHHYQGGPQTGVPHLAKHPKSSTSDANAKVRTPTSHHYSGGPQNPSHHMGDKK
jgi:hypothetical protein